MEDIPGVLLIAEAISAEYEQCILAQLPPQFLETQPEAIHKQTERASLQLHYFSPLPEVISMISEDVVPIDWKAAVWHGDECNSSIVQKYEPGEGKHASGCSEPHIEVLGIIWHTDLPIFGNGIAILSLLSTVVMQFRRIDRPHAIRGLVLAPRSLLLFSGDAQYKWQHQIAKSSHDLIDDQPVARGKRISMTLRQVIKT